MKKVFVLTWCDGNELLAISETIDKLFEMVICDYSYINLFWDERKRAFLTFAEEYGENWVNVLRGLNISSFNDIYEDVLCIRECEMF